ncbi:MAG: NAD(P)-dependent oxidoreductase [Spirochaetales bacterium]|jgi:nucleoside-diphosphate-sugar epimerase|nr:NAD(P)-dependent oxidoreductase [Spirochaetales bacterium]
MTPIHTETELEELLSRPSAELISLMKRLEGDILILGVAGKIGLTLGIAAARACAEAGVKKRIMGAARFSEKGGREKLQAAGVQTIPCDLLDRAAVEKLPDAQNVIFLAGKKFGTSGAESLTWAMNTLAPAYIAGRFSQSRILAYSTGCVYDFVSPLGGGSSETDTPHPQGDYAQSCLGRERVFHYFSEKYRTPVLIFRLNYAVEPRYGVLRDIADKVLADKTIDLATGNFNCIWQGDVISQTLLALELCASPPAILNVSGPETVSVRWAAREFGLRFGKTPVFTGTEQDRVWLTNAAKAASLFGYPRVTLTQAIDITAEWMLAGGSSLNKPTHFEARDGRY